MAATKTRAPEPETTSAEATEPTDLAERIQARRTKVQAEHQAASAQADDVGREEGELRQRLAEVQSRKQEAKRKIDDLARQDAQLAADLGAKDAERLVASYNETRREWRDMRTERVAAMGRLQEAIRSLTPLILDIRQRDEAMQTKAQAAGQIIVQMRSAHQERDAKIRAVDASQAAEQKSMTLTDAKLEAFDAERTLARRACAGIEEVPDSRQDFATHYPSIGIGPFLSTGSFSDRQRMSEQIGAMAEHLFTAKPAHVNGAAPRPAADLSDLAENLGPEPRHDIPDLTD